MWKIFKNDAMLLSKYISYYYRSHQCLLKNILLVLGEHFSGRAHNTLGLGPVPKTNQANLVVQVLATWKRNEAAWLTSESCEKIIPSSAAGKGTLSITRSQAQWRQQFQDLRGF